MLCGLIAFKWRVPLLTLFLRYLSLHCASIFPSVEPGRKAECLDLCLTGEEAAFCLPH